MSGEFVRTWSNKSSSAPAASSPWPTFPKRNPRPSVPWSSSSSAAICFCFAQGALETHGRVIAAQAGRGTGTGTDTCTCTGSLMTRRHLGPAGCARSFAPTRGARRAWERASRKAPAYYSDSNLSISSWLLFRHMFLHLSLRSICVRRDRASWCSLWTLAQLPGPCVTTPLFRARSSSSVHGTFLRRLRDL